MRGLRHGFAPALGAVLLLACGGDSEPKSDTDGGSSGEPATQGMTLGGFTTSTTGVEPGEQATQCVEYLMCIASVDPPSVDPASQRYGPRGSCWSSDADEAQECVAQCVMGLERLCGDPGPSTTTGVEGPPPCSLSALAPQAESWLVAGEAQQELPVEIGDLLERNCGCHLADLEAFEPNVPLYYGSLRISTWADFQQSMGGRPVHAEVHDRSIVTLSMPPLYFCGDEAFGSLSADDYALFEAWLNAGAPDAPQWAVAGAGTGTGG